MRSCRFVTLFEISKHCNNDDKKFFLYYSLFKWLQNNICVWIGMNGMHQLVLLHFLVSPYQSNKNH